MIASDPDDHRAVEQLFRALLTLGNPREAHDLLDRFDARCGIRAAEARVDLERRRGERPDDAIDTQDKMTDKREIHERKKLGEQASGFALMRALLRFQLDLVEERWADSERSFLDLQRISNDHHAELPALLVAELFAKSGNTEEALVWAAKALERDPENWHALSLAARLHFKSRRYDEALDLAAESLSLIYFQPRTHYLMGLAQQALGDFVGAELALRVAITQMPGLAVAHEALAELYDKELRRPADAALKRARASDIRRERKSPRDEVKESALARPDPRERVSFNVRPGPPPEDPSRDIVIVTGLPRSGTSMLMQVLVAGGINPLVDAHRPADDDNPRGYFEYEPATRSRQDDSWLPLARGKVVKLVLPLVPSLPPGESYRLVVIQRDLDEVLHSQRRMLDRLGRDGAVGVSQEALARQYRQQELRVGTWLDARPGIGVLPLRYDEILSDPRRTADVIATFLDRTFDIQSAAIAIDPSLRRQYRQQIISSPC